MIRNAVPELGMLEGALSLIEGQYYGYSEVAARLRQQSAVQSLKTSEISRLEEIPDVYASTRSFGFSGQSAVFYNPNGGVIDIDFSRYFLEPIEPGTQLIGLSINASLGRSVLSAIDSELKDVIIRNSVYWYAGRLTPAEVSFIKDHPLEALNAYAQSRRAILSTWKHFGRNFDGDESDAFRHFVWAGLLVQQLGDKIAGDPLFAHEHLPSNAKHADLLSSEMDQRNNAEGIKAGKSLLVQNALSLNRLEKEAYDALTQGRLRVLQSKGKVLIYPVN